MWENTKDPDKLEFVAFLHKTKVNASMCKIWTYTILIPYGHSIHGLATSTSVTKDIRKKRYGCAGF